MSLTKPTNFTGGTGVTLPTSAEELMTQFQYVDLQARAALARKIIDAITTADTTYSDGDGLRQLDPRGVAVLIDTLREMFQKEGINVSDKDAN